MARILPALESFQPVTAGDHAEYDCLTLLAGRLPAAYTVFHHLGWHTVHRQQDQFGELDAVVTTPTGRVICLEIKAGPVQVSADGIHKTYSGERKDILHQVHRQYGALRGSLSAANLHPVVTHYLVLPHYKWESSGTLALPRDRIIDSTQYHQLPAQLLALDAGRASIDETDLHRLNRHFHGEFGIALDVDAADRQESAAVRKMSEGLATWGLRIESPSGACLIEATAGSGKTQLALALLNDAQARGEKALYVCFNRLLAEHVARLAPTQATVDTFHQICRDWVEREGESIDFSTPGIFDHLAQRMGELASAQAGRYGCIIIDEAQDFEIDWIQSLIALGTQSRRLYVLRDENQGLYERETFELDDATIIRSNDNFRSPRQLVELINLLQLTPQPIRACAPFRGEVPGIFTYTPDDPASLLKATAQAVEECLATGYHATQIAILSAVGKERSAILGADHLAGRPLTHFARYDQDGNPVWTEGELLADTVYRFKGRSSPALVLTEIDFEELDARMKKILFVGITRARLTLKLVISNRTEAALARLLQSA